MTKNSFLSELSRLLAGINEEEKREILYDYEEHFRSGAEKGKTEEEISASLGDVRTIAKHFRASCTIKQAETNTTAHNTYRAVLAVIGLGFFNMVFILGPFLGLVGALIGFFAAAVGIVIAGVAIPVVLLWGSMIPAYIVTDINTTFAIFVAIGITCFGLLFFIGDCYMAKYLFGAMVKYAKWNYKIIRK